MDLLKVSVFFHVTSTVISVYKFSINSPVLSFNPFSSGEGQVYCIQLSNCHLSLISFNLKHFHNMYLSFRTKAQSSVLILPSSELKILLPRPPKYWYYNWLLPHLSSSPLLFIYLFLVSLFIYAYIVWAISPPSHPLLIGYSLLGVCLKFHHDWIEVMDFLARKLNGWYWIFFRVSHLETWHISTSQ
jgi:hypothetical protein